MCHRSTPGALEATLGFTNSLGQLDCFWWLKTVTGRGKTDVSLFPGTEGEAKL